MHTMTIAELSKMLKNKECSSLEMTQHFLNRIEKYDSKVNSYVKITHDHAINAAKNADAVRSKLENPSPLLGIPIAHKDLFSTKNIPTTSCSKMLANYIPPYDATCVEKLAENGVVMLGKLNMDEFAMGSSNETSFFGKCHNPWNLDYVPGGSSGGSAAAISAGLAPATTGTDTGGSIRLPASYCGITGLKPTYGRVSRYGMTAFASSLDQAGPMAKSAYDCALLLESMAGHDKNDSTSLNVPVPKYSKNLDKPIEGLRIGLPEEFFSADLDTEVSDILYKAVEQLKSLGAIIKSVSLPNNHFCIPTYYILAPAEASSNLSRFDGVRYGHRTKEYVSIEDMIGKSRQEGFGNEVKRRIITGTYVLSSGFYDAYYQKAQKVRTLIRHDFERAFTQVDVLLAPTAPKTAFKIGEKANDPISMYLCDVYTTAVNLAGLPAITAPAGFTNNLPIGMQLIGNHLEEHKILHVAHQYQQHTDHHLKMPKEFLT